MRAFDMSTTKKPFFHDILSGFIFKSLFSLSLKIKRAEHERSDCKNLLYIHTYIQIYIHICIYIFKYFCIKKSLHVCFVLVLFSY